MSKKNKLEDRRDFLKKSAYAAPALLTLKAVPAFAGSGSGRYTNSDSSSEGSWSESSASSSESSSSD